MVNGGGRKFLHWPQTRPSIWMLRTHSSSLAMSVSSSQGFTSSSSDDLAISVGSGGEGEGHLAVSMGLGLSQEQINKKQLILAFFRHSQNRKYNFSIGERCRFLAELTGQYTQLSRAEHSALKKRSDEWRMEIFCI